MSVAVNRQSTFTEIVAALTGLLDEIAAADGNRMQVLGWRGQRAHVPPSAWLNVRATTTHTKAHRVTDTIPFELWLTTPPSDSEGSELTALTALVDIALPIVDHAVSRTTSRERLGVDFVERPGFWFANAQTAESAGDPGDLLALVIPVSVRWTATAC